MFGGVFGFFVVFGVFLRLEFKKGYGGRDRFYVRFWLHQAFVYKINGKVVLAEMRIEKDL